ncbi:hypothetical protein A0H76_2115 [Hepatospora eriocheir]|uniref:Uncharacterized protein n=1 Tax=Hepatospora eriocheir TaxID=1081669 RepID=A0A1X0QK71_9MICR|nr:hypothetical protein A0H76_2115 [Hepatospora eriocheir]
MGKQIEIRQVINKSRKNAKKIREVSGDSNSILTLTPVHVMLFAFGLIFSVSILHLITKFLPSVSPIQIFTSVIVVVISIGMFVKFK